MGVSGGIDSLALVFLLQKYKEIYHQIWEIKACHIDTGFPGWDPSVLAEFLKVRGIECIAVKTSIYRKIRSVDDKCFSCSRYRRRKIVEIAEELNISNIALAHHQEDAVETILLNMFYAGRTSTLLPRQAIVHGRFAFVRPLYYLNKTIILKIAQAFGLKGYKNVCPFYKDSRRELIRNLLERVKKNNPDVYSNIFHSIFNIKKQYMPS